MADAIERDPELRAEYESLRSALATLRQHGPVSAPEGFKARVMAQVDRETASGGIVVQLRRRLTRVPLEAVAVAAAALIVVFTTTSQMSSPHTTGPGHAGRRGSPLHTPARDRCTGRCNRSPRGRCTGGCRADGAVCPRPIAEDHAGARGHQVQIGEVGQYQVGGGYEEP